ncbi:MAG TPA: tetratricopeptide repeat protein [Cyclobacteriaceae bacterium]|jgi:tetratricopeptide (TPR) repeat protein|nr:tetratricopeptide repeat protein [Cytophagales bacterium]HNT50611.1 tetratricopeptide repeat protein [Cyclobacteriaceae bacterium]HRE68852.1 tetratricopeptide repeat protein [Cyclobacteriaceae bacterium]HRF32655.1 tetratricopeptide repeat protein [Cyclobacteriaceae bacterium]
MAKIIQFPVPNPEKFGFKPVRKKKPDTETNTHGQLHLFGEARVINLNKLTAFEEALLLDEQGDNRAGQQYQKAIEAGDSVADAYCNLGIIESGKKQYTKAVDCFTKSLKADPRHFEAHYNLANVYAEIGNLALAKIHYAISIEIEPSFPNSYFNLGITLALNNEINEAIKHLLTYRNLSGEDQSQAEDLIASLMRSLH